LPPRSPVGTVLRLVEVVVAREHQATVMRCYYMRGGHIVDVDEISGPSDEEAIEKAQALFSDREDLFEGFELWDRTRMLIGHPQLSDPNNPVDWPLHSLETHGRFGFAPEIVRT
jgi:hypothetical protein